jgi:hypothetical protein
MATHVDLNRYYNDPVYFQQHLFSQLARVRAGNANYFVQSQRDFIDMKRDRCLHYLSILKTMLMGLQTRKTTSSSSPVTKGVYFFTKEHYLALTKLLLNYLPDIVQDRVTSIRFFSHLADIGMFSPHLYRTADGDIVVPFPVTAETIQMQKLLWIMFVRAIGGDADLLLKQPDQQQQAGGLTGFKYFNAHHSMDAPSKYTLYLTQIPIEDMFSWNLSARSWENSLFKDFQRMFASRIGDTYVLPEGTNSSSTYHPSLAPIVAEYDQFTQDIVQGIDMKHFRQEMINIVDNRLHHGKKMKMFFVSRYALLGTQATEISERTISLLQRFIEEEIEEAAREIETNDYIKDLSIVEHLFDAYVLALLLHADSLSAQATQAADNGHHDNKLILDEGNKVVNYEQFTQILTLFERIVSKGKLHTHLSERTLVSNLALAVIRKEILRSSAPFSPESSSGSSSESSFGSVGDLYPLKVQETFIRSIFHMMAMHMQLLKDTGLGQFYVPQKASTIAETNGELDSNVHNRDIVKSVIDFTGVVADELKFVYFPSARGVKSGDGDDEKAKGESSEQAAPEGYMVMPDSVLFTRAKHSERLLTELKGDRFSFYSLLRLRWMRDMAAVMLKNVELLGLAKPDAPSEGEGFAAKAYRAVEKYLQIISEVVQRVEAEIKDWKEADSAASAN